MIVAPTSSPSPTPAPTLASAYGFPALKPRQTFDLDYTYDADCLNVYGGLQCTTILSGCYSDFVQATNYNEAATACFCDYGISYLDCFYSQVATGTCASYYFGTEGYGEYQRSFYMDYCGSIPASAMAHIQPPTTVDLEFGTVDIVTATGAIKQPAYDGRPLYQGSGELLDGPCSETQFTRVDAGNTIYYAGFQGCIRDRPECCPFTVDTTATAPPGGATAAAGTNGKDASYDFPMPVDQDLLLDSCADDYYSISGGCCPNGFWPFTSEVGGIIPCWSSADRLIEPPTLTVNKEEAPERKPTSAVVNIVWSMRYPVKDSGSGGLSTAAKAGIGAGAGVAAILIAGLAICLWRARRKNKTLAAAQQTAATPQTQPQQSTASQEHQKQQPQVMQQAVPPNGQYPPGAYPPGMLAAGNIAPPSDRASIVTSMTPVSPLALAPQSTGTSGGLPSELSSQSEQQLLQNNNGYFPAGGTAAAMNPRVSYGSSSGAASPAVGPNAQGYPAPIAEADEGQQRYPQYGGYQQQYPQQQQQQQQQQYYYAVPAQQMAPQGQVQGQYYPPFQQGGYAYPQQQQQQAYTQNVSEMSAHREADPPQEVMGSQVQRPVQG